MPRLLLIHGGVVLRAYPLTESHLTLGRHASNDIQLDDPAVSAHHAVLRLEPNAYLEGYLDAVLEDLASTNGTLVNDQPIQRQVLRHGDRIRMGSHELLFEADEAQTLDQTTIYLPGGDA